MTTETSAPSIAHAIFCDDIRDEAGGKVTYVGVYGAGMFVSGFPITLPKLCVAVFGNIPKADPAPEIFVRLYHGADLEVELPIPSYDDNDLGEEAKCDGPPLPSPDTPEPRLAFLSHLARACFTLNAPTRLSVRVKIGNTVLKAGSLMIQQRPPQRQDLGKTSEQTP